MKRCSGCCAGTAHSGIVSPTSSEPASAPVIQKGARLGRVTQSTGSGSGSGQLEIIACSSEQGGEQQTTQIVDHVSLSGAKLLGILSATDALSDSIGSLKTPSSLVATGAGRSKAQAVEEHSYSELSDLSLFDWPFSALDSDVGFGLECFDARVSDVLVPVG